MSTWQELLQTSIQDEAVGRLADTNILGTLNVCHAASQIKGVVLLFISSGLVYGASSGDRGFNEQDAPQPPQVYSESKLAAEYVVRTFSCRQDFNGYIVRPFNHIGPYQGTQFVVPDFGSRIKQAVDGDSIEVGDLSSERDFTDVRDIVRAYRLILENQPEEKLFVLGSGKTIKIGDILTSLISLSGKSLNVERKAALIRSGADPKRVFGDYSLAQKVLGWQPEIPLEKSLRDAYEVL